MASVQNRIVQSLSIPEGLNTGKNRAFNLLFGDYSENRNCSHPNVDNSMEYNCITPDSSEHDNPLNMTSYCIY